MNKFSEQLLQAFEVAMDEKISTLQYDKTILATIESIENADTGEYKVKYKEGVISAFAYDPLESFKEGDSVYVTVPEGDFNNKKFISHKLSNNTLSTGQYKDLSETIIEVSPNVSSLGFKYGGQNVPQAKPTYWGLIAGHNNTSIDSITIMGTSTFSNSFQTYLDNYEYIRIKAEFMTSLDKSHVKGSYGVSLIFLDTENKQVPYFLTFSDFVGDPYHLGSWTPQSVVVKLPKGTLAKVQQISFWEKDFDDNVGEANQINLFMRNLSISFVEKVDMTQNPYFLSIVAREGTVFPSTGSVIHLAGRIINYGNEINPQNCIYQWFQRDLSVVSGSEDYDKRVGYGWKAISGATDKELAISGSSVIGEQQFKLLAVFNSTVVLTQQVILTRAFLQVSIEQEAANDTLKLKLVKLNASDAKTYVGDWYYLDTSGNYVKINGTTKVNQTPDVSPYLYYSPVTFYCSVYVGNAYQGELTHVMRNMESIDDASVVFIGESYFSYDANGDINIYDAELERTLTPQIVFNNGIISSSTTIEWLDFDGNVISDSYEWPSQSMITSVWVDTTTNILHYKIKHKFADYPSKNNSFKIRITTIDGQVYTFDKEIVCIKTGDPGTNGTKYQSLIRLIQDDEFPYQFVYTGSIQFQKTSNSRVVSWIKDNKAIKYGIARQRRTYTVSTGVTSSWTTDVAEVSTTLTSYTDTAGITTSTSSIKYQYRYLVRAWYGDTSATAWMYSSVFSSETTQGYLPGNNIYNAKVKLYCYVYRDGEILSSDSYNVLWEYYNVTAEHEEKTYVVVRSNNGTQTRYVKVKIDISDQGTTTTLYNFYAIDSSTNPIPDIKVDLSELPNKIQYAANGLNPQCRRQVPTIEYITNISVPSSYANQLVISNNNFIPASSFNPASNIALLQLTYKKSSTSATIYHPIPMYINTYGNEAINGWDGHQLDIDANGQYVFAPQIGAGVKNSDNTFTGVVMGKDSTQNKIGLYGYEGGHNTFGLKADGEAYFGKSGNGRITINGNTAEIRGGPDGGDSASGMTINLYGSKTTDNAIKAGNGNFSVNYGGIVTAKGATIDGHLYALDGKIGSTSKTSNDGWTITTNRIASGSSSNHVALDSGSATIRDKAKYYTNANLTANEKTISGDTQIFNYTTYSGKTYVSFKLSGNSTLYYTLTENTSTDYAIWAGTTFPNQSKEKFSVKRDGTVFMREAIVKGTITAKAGAIGCDNDGNGGWIIKTNTLSSESDLSEEWIVPIGVTYYTDIDCKNPNKKPTESTHIVTKAGDNVWSWFGTGSNTTYYAKEEDVVLNTNKSIIVLSANNSQVIQAGAVTGGKAAFSVAKTGKLRAQNAEIVGTITAENGEIGGWKIEADQLSSGKVYLYSGDSYKLNDSAYRFWAGDSTPSNAKFYILNNGNIKATAADITGTINAKKGLIGCDDNDNGGWVIGKNRLSSESITEKWSIPSGATYYKDSACTNAYEKLTENSHVVTQNSDGAWYWTASGTTYYAKEEDIVCNLDKSAIILSARDGQAIQAGKIINKKPAFSVSKAGKLVAQNADIVGTITADSGKIGGKEGWTIESYLLYSGNVCLYSGTDYTRATNEYYRIWAGSGKSSPSAADFSVTDKGYLTAKKGLIGGWIIDSGKLYSDNGKRGLSSNGVSTDLSEQYINTSSGAVNYYVADTSTKLSLAKGVIRYITDVQKKDNSNSYFYFVDDTERYYVATNKITSDGKANFVLWSGATYDATNNKLTLPKRYFAVSTTGKLYTADAEISGKITADSGSIGGWKITSTKLQNEEGTIYLDSSTGTISGATVSGGTVTGATVSGGTVTGATVSGGTVTGASISGGTVSGTSISGGSININDKFIVDTNGKLEATEADISGIISADEGTIAGWSLTKDNDNVKCLSGGNLKLKSNGSILLSNATGNVDLVTMMGSIKISGQTKHCTGFLGLQEGYDGWEATYNTMLYSTKGLILGAEDGGARMFSTQGIYLESGTFEDENFYPTSQLQITNSGLSIPSTAYGTNHLNGWDTNGSIYFEYS